MLKTKVIACEQLPEGKNIYRDYYLAFEPAHPIPVNPPKQELDRVHGITAPQSLVIHVSSSVRTVTFSIAAVNSTLYSLDTFSPSSNWTIDGSLVLPCAVESGILQFTTHLVDGGIATVRTEMIECRVNPELRVVQLRFERAGDIRFARVADCLIAGMDNDSSDLVEMWLKDVSGI